MKLQRPPPEMRIFFPGSVGMVDQQDLASALARGECTHHPRRTAADNDRVISTGWSLAHRLRDPSLFSFLRAPQRSRERVLGRRR